MNFVTLEFATFFLFVLVAGWLLRERDGEYRAFLLVCNLFFYALAGMAFVPLLLAVAVLNWGAVHLMSRFSGQPRKRKGVIALDVALHVALLAFFKYYEFLILGLESLASAAGLDTGILRHALPSMEILFPVGLSFYTFQGLSYAIDLTAARTSRRARFWTCCCSCPSSPRSWRGRSCAPGSSCRSSGTGHGIPATCRKGSRLSSAGCSRRS